MENSISELNRSSPTAISTQISEVVKYLIISLSLLLTGLFFYENSGFALASMLVLAQLYVTLNFPANLADNIKKKTLGTGLFNACILVIVLGFSIAGSFFFLTQGTQTTKAVLKQREVLEAQIDLKLESAKKLVALDYITRSELIYAEVNKLQNEINNLPIPDGLDAHFISLFGSGKGILFFSIFMILASAIVDIVAMISFANHNPIKVSNEASKANIVRNKEAPQASSNPIDENDQGKKNDKHNAEESVNIFTLSQNPDVAEVIKAVKSGDLPSDFTNIMIKKKFVMGSNRASATARQARKILAEMNDQAA